MGKDSVIVYVTLAVLILYLISYSIKKHSTRNHHHHRRLKLRYSSTHHDPHPAPAEESQPELDDFLNAEDYLNDGDKFNVTNRLVLLFPKIDVDPADGFVTENELIEWNLQQATKEVLFRSLREREFMTGTTMG
ncbi:Detected protein of confused Function [Hibiscus syriacus]|uniref:Detected protein of confused Function n=1 Tax=Hibiscus syriacus TaxID=106335 RepID=A0A6A2XN82_HIBSY|nr:Detected protein of confused Function [Hibiscus syriacus]